MAGGAETPNIAALPAIARLGTCESARGPDADRHVKLLSQFAVEGSLSGAYSHLLSDARIPVWWTQHPANLPVLTGWFGGPKTEAMANLGEHGLIEAGLASLAEIFGCDPKELMRNLVAARAINWAHDPLAGGAYSYATPETRAAQEVLSRRDGGVVFFSGEALYRGRDLGTVEAALASGLETARNILRG